MAELVASQFELQRLFYQNTPTSGYSRLSQATKEALQDTLASNGIFQASIHCNRSPQAGGDASSPVDVVLCCPKEGTIPSSLRPQRCCRVDSLVSVHPVVGGCVGSLAKRPIGPSWSHEEQLTKRKKSFTIESLLG
uniref:Uncharacterized protein n=1 Tax=Trichuris muris TaxID=70415 RepID=A0A5S6QDM7_TRIMR